MAEQKCIFSDSYLIERGNNIQRECYLSVVPYVKNFPEKAASPSLNQFSPSTRLVENGPSKKKQTLTHVQQDFS